MKSWIVGPRTNHRASLRLFCFPYAGGSAAIYHDWQRHLPPSVEVCAVELPGRGGRHKEEPFDRIEPLVDALAKALLPYLDRPFTFFGHSMGALLSFELTRRLRRDFDLAPAHLFVSGHGAPQMREMYPVRHDLPEPEFLDELHRLNGTPPEVLGNPEIMQILMPVLRADFALCEFYKYTDEPPLDCPISAFSGLRDQEMSREKLEGWREQTTSAFSLRMFPGDHFFINTARPLLLQILYRQLYELVGASPRI